MAAILGRGQRSSEREREIPTEKTSPFDIDDIIKCYNDQPQKLQELARCKQGSSSTSRRFEGESQGDSAARLRKGAGPQTPVNSDLVSLNHENSSIPIAYRLQSSGNRESMAQGSFEALQTIFRQEITENDEFFRQYPPLFRNVDNHSGSNEPVAKPPSLEVIYLSEDPIEVRQETDEHVAAQERELLVSRFTQINRRAYAEATKSSSDLPLPVPARRQADPDDIEEPDQEIDLEGQATAFAVSIEDEKDASANPNPGHTKEGLGFLARYKMWFRAAYAPATIDFPLILPSAPTDKEKLGYLRTNRFVLYLAGLFSFLSLATGMWLFVVSSAYFAWFGILCVALQLYMGIGYYVGLFGKDFDYKNHQRIITEFPIDPDKCPTVDIYLPVCKEPIEILANTWKYVEKLKWPAGKLKFYVLDDGAQDSVRELAMKFKFEYIVRGDRPRLKKAGNLRWAFQRTTGDFFNIYDADFCPRDDFLLEIVPVMLDGTDIAIVQTPQFFRTREDQTWVEQGAGGIQELFYRVIQVNRDKWGASICVGSNALYRREALVDVGGTAEIGFSEDVHTGFGCVDRGWRVKFVPLCLACGVCPDQPRAFFSQQMRWCMGSTTLLSNPEFWKSKLTKKQKMCYLCGMMYYSAVSLSIFINPMPGIFMVWLRPQYFKYYNLAFAIPSVLYTVIWFRFWAKASFGMNVQYIQTIQAYAYFTAIKDKIVGKALQWAPSGDNKAHKNNKYRNMRIMAWCWLISWMTALLSGMLYQIILHGMPFYDCIPLLCLDLFNFWTVHRFLFAKA